MNWSNRVAVVTGASSGIGSETAKALLRKGATVVLAARRKERLDALMKSFTETGATALAVQTDVSIETQVEALFETVLREYGRVDWLINNAGSGLHAPIEDTTPEQMERLWRTNFMGTFYCIRNAIPIMKRQKEGHILTVSSMAGMRGTPLNGAYCATKFAQVGLMDSLRRELTGIHCTIILPGATETEFVEAMENPAGAQIRSRGSIQQPAEVAGAILHAIEHPTARVITQKFGRTLLLLNALSPGLTDRLTEKVRTGLRAGRK
jgi:NAD(P)-dependent dehydrogenase (short-subunit alcohol dehydrogenase family)